MMRIALNVCFASVVVAQWWNPTASSYTYDKDEALSREIYITLPPSPPYTVPPPKPPPSASPLPPPLPSPPPGPPPPDPPSPPPVPECWYRGQKVDSSFCVNPPPPMPSPPPPPPPSPMPPPPPYFLIGNGTNTTSFEEPDLYVLNVVYLGGCATLIGAAAYSYAQEDNPGSVAGTAARSFRAALPDREMKASKKVAPAAPRAAYGKLPKLYAPPPTLV